MNIQLYTRNGCVSCNSAKEFLNSKNIQYQQFIVDQDISLSQIKEQFPLATSLPICVVDDVWIGGYEKLRIFITDAGL